MTSKSKEQQMHHQQPGVTVKTPAANFTGDVYMDPIAAGDSLLVVGHVRFTPGARTNWHSHANGQLPVCTDGIGLVANREGVVSVLRPGQSVWTPPGEQHWHGGCRDHFMAHYAILTETPDRDATVWLEPVTDHEYDQANLTAETGG